MLTLTAKHISLKVNLKYDLVTKSDGGKKLNLKFEVTNMNHDIALKNVQFQMEGNTAANLLNKAADLAHRLFVDKLVEKMASSIEELLKNNLPKILEETILKDEVYAGILGIISQKNLGQQIYQIEMMGSASNAEYEINGDLKLSVPKLMILGILYSASSAR